MSAVLNEAPVATPTPATPATPEQLKQQADLAAAAKAALAVKIKAQFNNLVDIKDSKYFFKKTDVEGPDPKDPTGEKKVKIGEVKRPTVELPLPVPSVEGLVDILQNGRDETGKQILAPEKYLASGNTKAFELVFEALAEVVSNRARDLINDDEKITGVENFPMEELSWDKIADLPKAERRGGGISKEIWDAFAEDYIAIMPGITNKTAEQVANAAKILINKFNQVKTIKPVLKLMKDQLGLYVANSPNAETYAECVKFLVEKADALLNFNEADLLKNL